MGIRRRNPSWAPATLKHHWSTLRGVFVYAQHHKAIMSNPIDGVDFSGSSAKRRNKRHHPLTAEPGWLGEWMRDYLDTPTHAPTIPRHRCGLTVRLAARFG